MQRGVGNRGLRRGRVGQHAVAQAEAVPDVGVGEVHVHGDPLVPAPRAVDPDSHGVEDLAGGEPGQDIGGDGRRRAEAAVAQLEGTGEEGAALGAVLGAVAQLLVGHLDLLLEDPPAQPSPQGTGLPTGATP